MIKPSNDIKLLMWPNIRDLVVKNVKIYTFGTCRMLRNVKCLGTSDDPGVVVVWRFVN